MPRIPKLEQVSESDAVLSKVTTEMEALTIIVKSLSQLPEQQQRAVLRAVNAYFEGDKRDGRYD